MAYISAVIVTVIVVELFCRLPLIGLVSQLTGTLRKASRVILSHSISDHWKEKVLLVYSRRIALTSIKIMMVLIGVVLVAVGISDFLDRVFALSDPVLELLVSWLGASLAALVSVLYLFLRSHFVGQ